MEDAQSQEVERAVQYTRRRLSHSFDSRTPIPPTTQQVQLQQQASA